MKPPNRPAHLSGRIFRGSDHTLTDDELRSGAWRRLCRNAYADAEIPASHGLRCAGAHILMPATAAVGGLSAAWFYGVRLVGDNDPIEVITPTDQPFGPVKGLRIRVTDLPAEDVVDHLPRLTTPLRTAWDIARFHPVPESLAYLDLMVSQRLVTVSDLERRLRQANVRWGRRRAATAIRLIDPRSESPQESRLRAHLALADVPAPVVQHSVHFHGRFVARVDLAWPEWRVAVEYDGAWHGDPRQFHRDRQRLNQLVAAGWTVIHVTSVRMRDAAGVVAEVRAALARAGA